jgi:hypothetical protein
MPPTRFQIAHRLTRRLRILSPLLKDQPERCYILEILLRKRPEIRAVRCVPGIGSVAIHYDPARLPEERLIAVLDAVIGNIATRPAKPSAPPVENDRPPPGVLGGGGGDDLRLLRPADRDEPQARSSHQDRQPQLRRGQRQRHRRPGARGGLGPDRPPRLHPAPHGHPHPAPPAGGAGAGAARPGQASPATGRGPGDPGGGAGHGDAPLAAAAADRIRPHHRGAGRSRRGGLPKGPAARPATRRQHGLADRPGRGCGLPLQPAGALPARPPCLFRGRRQHPRLRPARALLGGAGQGARRGGDPQAHRAATRDRHPDSRRPGGGHRHRRGGGRRLPAGAPRRAHPERWAGPGGALQRQRGDDDRRVAAGGQGAGGRR